MQQATLACTSCSLSTCSSTSFVESAEEELKNKMAITLIQRLQPVLPQKHTTWGVCSNTHTPTQRSQMRWPRVRAESQVITDTSLNYIFMQQPLSELKEEVAHQRCHTKHTPAAAFCCRKATDGSAS